MKLIFIRHGDPDYANDCLTEKGRREAELLSKKVRGMKIDKCFLSPLGRAQQTAHACIDGTGTVPVTFDWLREFSPLISRPDLPDAKSICWDWMPADWTRCSELYDYDKWQENPVFKNSDAAKEFNHVHEEFGKLLASLGYIKEGNYFRAEHPNNDTIVFFCHFGIEMVMLSYLLHLPIMPLWQGFLAPTSSITTVVTEERQPQRAAFRIISFGDVSHLDAGNEPVSFSGRFCECYTNENERH